MAHAFILVTLQPNEPSAGVHPPRHVDWFDTWQDEHGRIEEAILPIACMGWEGTCPYFRGLLSHNRALVPACGYYEWQGEGRDKTPYYIHPQDQQYIAFAGLYDMWINPAGEELYTFTIITTEADPFMARLHHRMPIILTRKLEEAWLDPELTKAQEVLDLLSRGTGLKLDAYPVSRTVNRPSVDSQLLIQRAE